MSEERGIGAALKAAREKKGWTTGDAGSRLRLMSRQIEAIEAEEFSRLGPPVFARGFVRNYARLLGLDPDDLLDQMTRIKTAPVQEAENLPFTPSEGFWKSPWVLGGIVAAILLIAVPVGLYLWLNSGEEEEAAPAIEKPVPPPPPPPAPVLDMPPAAPTGVPPADATSAAPQAVPAQPAPTSGTAAPATSPPAKPTASPMPAPQVQQPAPATAASAPAALRLQFDQAAWVQVRDSSGRLVHSGMNPAGSSVEVDGKAPFYLVVGNAEQVRVTYKGQAVDLKPYTAVNVARLTLNP